MTPTAPGGWYGPSRPSGGWTSSTEAELIDDSGPRRRQVAGGGQVGGEQRIGRGQEAIEVADARVVIADELGRFPARQGVMQQGVLLVGDPAERELAMEPDVDTVAARFEGELCGALALRARERVGGRLEDGQRPEADVADADTGPILDVGA